jgi:serine/threonine protein kinase
VIVWQTRYWFPWFVTVGVQIPVALGWSLLWHSRRPHKEVKTLVETAEQLSHEKRNLAEELAEIQTPRKVLDLPISASDSVGLLSIPDYEILSPIGEGAYGEVRLARNAVGIYYAVKIIHRERRTNLKSFEREFRGIQSFMPLSSEHPGLVLIRHVGRDQNDNYFYYVMDLADDEVSGRRIDPQSYSARNLAKDLEKRKCLPMLECVELGLALSDALAYLHSSGLVHRDIKPSNIIFVGGMPKLADIGLVTQVGRADMSVVGTPGFIDRVAPGTVAGDIFSFGRLLYVSVTGRPPEEFPHLPSDLESESEAGALSQFRTIISRACQLESFEPYRSANEMQSDLARLRQEICRKMSGG